MPGLTATPNPAGIKVSDEEMDRIDLRRDELRGEWNYEDPAARVKWLFLDSTQPRTQYPSPTIYLIFPWEEPKMIVNVRGHEYSKKTKDLVLAYLAL